MKIQQRNISIRGELRIARALWGKIGPFTRENLRILASKHRLSISAGDLALMNGRWYVTASGLLALAKRNGCFSIKVAPVRTFCDVTNRRYVFRATVYKSSKCNGFTGYGDADPSNVSPLVHGAEMRIAETRAVNRALRKAYGIGICSVEEFGALTFERQGADNIRKLPPKPARKDGSDGSGPRVRDRLCQIIRSHQLDAELVKAYATDFCGTKTLREASREQVENFVQHLADWAQKDRNAVLCQLNSYARHEEGAA